MTLCPAQCEYKPAGNWEPSAPCVLDLNYLNSYTPYIRCQFPRSGGVQFPIPIPPQIFVKSQSYLPIYLQMEPAFHQGPQESQSLQASTVLGIWVEVITSRTAFFQHAHPVYWVSLSLLSLSFCPFFTSSLLNFPHSPPKYFPPCNAKYLSPSETSAPTIHWGPGGSVPTLHELRRYFPP